MVRTYARYPQSMIGLDYRSFDASGNYSTKRSSTLEYSVAVLAVTLIIGRPRAREGKRFYEKNNANRIF